MVRSVTYFIEAPITRVGDRLGSPLASARYRVIQPATHLDSSGIPVSLRQAGTGDTPAIPSGADHVVIVSKSFEPATLRAAEAARTNGNRLVVDLCDDHFDRPGTGAHLRALCALADHVVASTPTLAGRALQVTGRDATVISDPYEGPAGEARFDPAQDVLRLLWFGHPTNLESLAPLLQQLGVAMLARPGSELSRRQVVLEIVSSGLAALQPQFTQIMEQLDGRLRIIASEWSEDSTWQALQRADIVVIPSLPTAQKLAKSPNRLVEGIRAGRLVVAHPVPSYTEFADFTLLGDDIGALIEQALQSGASAMTARISAGQAYIESRCSPAAIGEQWLRAVSRPSPVRLNLGCGDKILPGFTNVDVVESRAGNRPDVICDLHKLHVFPDGHADEVMAIHVVEHFWRWEVVDILREWLRVLKPGGRMVLECPNLISACEMVLRDPALATGPGKEGQRSMWVLYGDPAWRDPLMCHRWAYTPQSLAQVMAEAGLCNIRQEPAQYKLREPRDMRIVGEKPATASQAA